VMYAAELVEGGRADAVLARPLHPYTQALLSAQPPLVADPPNRLEALGGSPPDLAQPPSGCRFHPRCPLRDALGSPAVCETSAPPRKTDGEQWATCHFPAESRDRWRARTSPAAV
jgi:oligopeptide/dipeptide ABC transporter ATP-binding protein